MTDDWNRLARYFAGELSPEDAEATRRWIAEDPERVRMAEEMREAWESAAIVAPDASEPQWHTDSSWQKLSARLRTRERRVPLGLVRTSGPYARQRASRAPWIAGLAAAAALVFLAVGRPWQREVVAPDTATTTTALREVRTVRGQRAVLTLGDGSRVVLGPASALRYDTAQFGVTTRELELSGEAHFTVAHMAGPQAPAFIVRTNHGSVQDVGTAFNVRAFDSRRGLEVVVTDGSVLMAGDTLKRGDLGQLDAAGRLRVEHGVSVDRYMAWTEGRLVFDRTPLRDLIPELERWYDIDISLADTGLGSRRFAGTLREGAAASAVQLLALSLDLQVERLGRKVRLSPKGAPVSQ